jgi:hypothetical protein
MSESSEPMTDPLQLLGKDPANSVRIARAAPHPDIERIHKRLTSGEYADAHEVRLALLAHLVYFAYRDIKETCNL